MVVFPVDSVSGSLQNSCILPSKWFGDVGVSRAAVGVNILEVMQESKRAYV